MVASAGPGPPPGAGASIPEGGTSEPLVAPSYSAVSWISRTFFSYVDPLLDRASKGPLEEDDVEWIPPESDKAENLSVKFEREYAKVKARYAPPDADPDPAGTSGTAAPGPGSKGPGPGQARRAQRRPWTTITGITLLRLYWGQMILESFWVLVEVAQRLGTPVALREFLRWLQAYDAGENPPEWRGWVMAGVLGLCGSTMIIIHHQLFWIGMRNGFLMRQQVVAAVHAKVLRLNSAAVSVLSTGHVVNLVSNDVRRFDDVAPFWIFLWAAPLELCMVLLMVSLELDFLSALAGVATSLAVIPLQSALVRYIGGLRRNTARCTDERVRLAGEVVEGALAMKMLSWEDPFTDALRNIRKRETHFSRRMQRIRAVNFAMQFCTTPIVSFVTFAVYRARNGSLNVASVFYALSLLHLPKLYMVNFFVLAVQTMTELRVSLQRIDAFLSTPEPPHPASDPSVSGPGGAQPGAGPAAAFAGAQPGPAAPKRSLDVTGAIRRSLELALSHARPKPNGATPSSGANGGSLEGQGQAQAQAGPGVVPVGTVAMRGADYDWARPFGRNDLRLTDTHGTALGGGAGDAKGRGKGGGKGGGKGEAKAAKCKGAEGKEAAGGGEVVEGALTLVGPRFECAPGELLGICGAVGAGKSSLLAALLGELQPLAGAAAEAARARTAAAAVAAEAPAGAAAAEGDVQIQLQVAADAEDDGGPLVRGRVAYCSQVPWIVAGSVRENILFGAPWDAAWFSRVVWACCLADDLAQLPMGDATELGERGINLSGGQKARVALARACYARPSVALLDDPLSAVDPRVGRDLFARALGPGGLLAECGATRLLVTHQRQYLPKCDRVMVLRGGRILALAPWREVAPLQLPELTAGHGGVCSGADGGGGDSQAAGADAAAAAEAEAEAGTVDEVLDALAEARAAAATAAATAAAAATADGDKCNGDVCCGGGVPAAGSASGSDDAAIVVAPTAAAAAADGKAASADYEATSPKLPPSTCAADGAAAAADAGSCYGAQSGYSVGNSGYGAANSITTANGNGTNCNGNGNGDGKTPSGGSRFWKAARRGSSGLGADRYRLSLSRTFGAGRFPADASGGGADGDGAGGGRGNSLWGWRAFSRLRALPSAAALRSAGSASLQRVDTGKLVASEDRVTGTVSWGVYGSYCRHLGLAATALILGALVAGQAVFLASEWWLAMWARSDEEDQGDTRWLWVYGMLTGIVIAVAFMRSAVFFEATLDGATSIHNAMAKRVLRAPLSFFHTNPSGRIVNRFSKDQGQVDDLLPSCLFDALQSAFLVLGALVLAAIAVPVILPVFLPLLVAFWYIRRRYITASREIKRWEAVTRSPVFASFSATLKGLPTIRAYGAAHRFNDAFLRLMTHNGNWYFSFVSTSRWIGVRLDAVASVTLLATALLAVAMKNSINTGVLALALTHVLQLTGMMQWVVRQTAEVENTMTSVERMLAYTALDSEPPRLAEGGAAPPEGWPRSGALAYVDVTAVYRPGLPPVLRNLSFTLPPGTSCGVVGRTGSGKSSLMLTLFRLIDVTHGTIFLDGVDTSAIGLDALRKQLAIIPQDPVLFSGTLRSNLDPWRTADDSALWATLEAVQLKAAVAATPGGLDAPMSEAGGNLSVGQRQLFCLARALLQDARVLALDEATANVDRATDALIQSALRDFAHRDRELHGRVLLVIAHRIDTVMDTDHLLVLSAGELVESGAPAELAAGEGVFSKMVAAARPAGGAGAAVGAAGAVAKAGTPRKAA